MSHTSTILRIPTELKPADGRFGSGPSRVRPAQLRPLPRHVDDEQADQDERGHQPAPARADRRAAEAQGDRRDDGSGEREILRPDSHLEGIAEMPEAEAPAERNQHEEQRGDADQRHGDMRRLRQDLPAASGDNR